MFGSSIIVDRTEDCGNGFGWSIIEWVDDSLYHNDYEFAVLRDGNICYDSGVTRDVVRGDWTMMEKFLIAFRRKSFGGNDLGGAGPPPGAVSPYTATTYDYSCIS